MKERRNCIYKTKRAKVPPSYIPSGVAPKKKKHNAPSCSFQVSWRFLRACLQNTRQKKVKERRRLLILPNFSIDNGNGKHHKQRVSSVEKVITASCTCGTHFRTIPCHPLQINNVKSPNLLTTIANLQFPVLNSAARPPALPSTTL